MNIHILFLLSVATIAQVSIATAQPTPRVNILFCVADDAGHMSAYGVPWINTPAFDTVTRNGLLFNKKDPNCMVNLIQKKEYTCIKDRMEEEMTRRLLDQKDPRMYNKGDIFDKYPDTSEAHDFWHRIRNGERVPTDWINISDFEEDFPQ